MSHALKHLGCCTVCDEPCFEIASRWTEGPYKDEIKEVGRPLPFTRRVAIVRASGNQSFWTLCATCTIDALDFPELNRKEIAAMVKEEHHGRARRTPEQQERREQMLKLFVFDIPIGVLGEISWSEVK